MHTNAVLETSPAVGLEPKQPSKRRHETKLVLRGPLEEYVRYLIASSDLSDLPQTGEITLARDVLIQAAVDFDRSFFRANGSRNKVAEVLGWFHDTSDQSIFSAVAITSILGVELSALHNKISELRYSQSFASNESSRWWRELDIKTLRHVLAVLLARSKFDEYSLIKALRRLADTIRPLNHTDLASLQQLADAVSQIQTVIFRAWTRRSASNGSIAFSLPSNLLNLDSKSMFALSVTVVIDSRSDLLPEVCESGSEDLRDELRQVIKLIREKLATVLLTYISTRKYLLENPFRRLYYSRLAKLAKKIEKDPVLGEQLRQYRRDYDRNWKRAHAAERKAYDKQRLEHRRLVRLGELQQRLTAAEFQRFLAQLQELADARAKLATLTPEERKARRRKLAAERKVDWRKSRSLKTLEQKIAELPPEKAEAGLQRLVRIEMFRTERTTLSPEELAQKRLERKREYERGLDRAGYSRHLREKKRLAKLAEAQRTLSPEAYEAGLAEIERIAAMRRERETLNQEALLEARRIRQRASNKRCYYRRTQKAG